MSDEGCLFFLFGILCGSYSHHFALAQIKRKVNPPLDHKIGLLSGVLFMLSMNLAPQDDGLSMLLFLTLFTSTVFYDYYGMMIPSAITYIHLILLGLLKIVVSSFNGWISSVGIGLFFIAFNHGYHYLFHVLPMGEGDIDIIVAMSLVLSFEKLVIALLISSLTAGIIGGCFKMKKLPFVPFLAFGSWFTYIWI